MVATLAGKAGKLENVVFFRKYLEKLEKDIISPQYQLEKLDFKFCPENESQVMTPKLCIWAKFEPFGIMKFQNFLQPS